MPIEKKQFVRDLNFKEEVESLFLVKYIAVMEARDGRSYLNMILADATGDLECRIWHNAEQIAERIEKSDFVQVKGKLNKFQGRQQLIIAEIERIEASDVNRDDYVMKSSVPAETMYADLLAIVDDLNNVYIRDLLLAVLNEPEIARRLKLWPAGKSIHHAYESGLLEHILSCSQLGLFLSKQYKADVNYVVAGCILHDLCKIYELTDGLNTEYTEEGRLVGHLSQAVELVERFSHRLKNFPYALKLHLKHILLSHHGSLEYGSPKVPQTREAYLVHLIDFMDSKMNSMQMLIDADKNSGRWTNYNKTLERIVYKEPLPHYDEYLQTASEETERSKTKARKAHGRQEKEPKQNLGALLKNFKLESE